jgi:hypothetical protein
MEALLPSFLRDARDLEAAWIEIDRQVPGGSGSWKRRRAFVADGLRDCYRVAESAANGPIDQEAATVLESLDSGHVSRAWERVVQRRDTDPAAAITAARSLLETVCKHILDELDTVYCNRDSVGSLYVSCAQSLGVHPTSTSERQHKRFLQSCVATAEAIGLIRNIFSDAHGFGPNASNLPTPQAALVVDLARALSLLLTRTLEAKRVEAPDEAELPGAR